MDLLANPLAVQHIANAHPKVRCCGMLMDESDLDGHYLNSRNHPACDKCNVGFPSEQEYTEVRRAEQACRVNFFELTTLDRFFYIDKIAQFRATLRTTV
jgi:hypothetical protein